MMTMAAEENHCCGCRSDFLGHNETGQRGYPDEVHGAPHKEHAHQRLATAEAARERRWSQSCRRGCIARCSLLKPRIVLLVRISVCPSACEARCAGPR